MLTSETFVDDRAGAGCETWKDLFHYWFVRYNPLYFFSALCVLGGVFLVSNGLERSGMSASQPLLLVVLELYQVVLIGGAALLYRAARQRRPAAILGIMTICFLMDCTFQTEVMGSLTGVGLLGSVAWLVLVGIKLLALAWAFELRVSIAGLAGPFLAALAIAFAPHILASSSVDKSVVHLMLTWYGVGLAAYNRLIPLRIESRDELSEWGEQVLYRVQKAVWVIWGTFYVIHLTAWAGQFSVALTSAHVATIPIAAVLLTRREGWVWAWTAVALAILIRFPSLLTSPAAMILAIVVAVQARRLKQPRLIVAVVAGMYVAIWTMGQQSWPLSVPPAWLGITAGIVLAACAVAFRHVLPALAAVAVLLPAVWRFRPATVLEWGIAAITVGFLALVAGIAINWELRRHSGPGNGFGGVHVE